MRHVAFALNHRFVHPCAVAILSILRHNDPESLTFHIVGEDLDDGDTSILETLVRGFSSNIAFYTVPEALLRGYEVKWERKRLSKVVFYRCLFASILPEEISTVLYLDCDLLVLAPLDDLWLVNLRDKALAAVPDAYPVNTKHCERLGYPVSDNYFNGGVLLLNLFYWREHSLEQQCKAFYNAHADKLLYNDQDLLNGLLHNRKILLDMRWNVQENAYRLPKGDATGAFSPCPFLKTLESPFILHYSGRKPWQYHCMHPFRQLYFTYENLLPGIKARAHGRPESFLRHFHLLPYTLGWKRQKYRKIRYVPTLASRIGSSLGDPLISIIVPMYNVEAYVAKCIHSLRLQTYTRIEVLIVDDASTDRSYEVCKAAIGDDQRFKLARSPINKGVAETRNKGLALASGEYIGFVDPDDWIEPDMYESLYHGCVKNGTDIAQCGCYQYTRSGIKPHCAVKRTITLSTRTALKLLFKDHIVKNYLWNKLFKSTLFEGLQFPAGHTFEDLLIMSTLFERAKKVCLTDVIGYHYVERYDSIVATAFRENQLTDYLDALSVKRKHAQALGLWMDADRFLAHTCLKFLNNGLVENNCESELQTLKTYLRDEVDGCRLWLTAPFLALRRLFCLHAFGMYKTITLWLKHKRK